MIGCTGSTIPSEAAFYTADEAMQRLGLDEASLLIATGSQIILHHEVQLHPDKQPHILYEKWYVDDAAASTEEKNTNPLDGLTDFAVDVNSDTLLNVAATPLSVETRICKLGVRGLGRGIIDPASIAAALRMSESDLRSNSSNDLYRLTARKLLGKFTTRHITDEPVDLLAGRAAYTLLTDSINGLSRTKFNRAVNGGRLLAMHINGNAPDGFKHGYYRYPRETLEEIITLSERTPNITAALEHPKDKQLEDTIKARVARSIFNIAFVNGRIAPSKAASIVKTTSETMRNYQLHHDSTGIDARLLLEHIEWTR